MASKNGSGGQALKTDPTAAAPKRPEIPRRIRNAINEAFEALEDQGIEETNAAEVGEKVRASVAAKKKEVLAFMNGLLKNQKPAD